MQRAIRMATALIAERSVRSGVLGICLAAFAWNSTHAAQFELPANGIFEIGGYSSPTTGSFSVSWNPYPNFDQSDFGVGNLSVSVNGAVFSISDTLGKCPVSFCGPPSTVIDNVFGSHPGPGGESIFSISNSELTIVSIASIGLFNNFDPNNPDPIGPPGVWKITADLPEGLYVTPLPGAFPLFATGLGALALLTRRRKRKSAALAS
jgi:hypothetical protein